MRQEKHAGSDTHEGKELSYNSHRKTKQQRMACWVRECEEQSYNSQRVPTAMRLEWHTGSEKSPDSNETENENGMLG